MSIKNTKIIDAIGYNDIEKTITLLLIDTLKWKKEIFHLEKLQDKINAYIWFIENEEYREKYPDKNVERFKIEIHSMYPYPVRGIDYIAAANIQIFDTKITIVLER